MNKQKMILLIGLILISISSVLAKTVDPAFINAMKKLYPEVKNIEWSSKHDYKIASFVQNDTNISIWFDNKAQWIMAETNVENTSQLPIAVTEAFDKSLMSGFEIAYIRVISFPKDPTVIVIDVNDWANNHEFQQFYDPDGQLLQSLSGEIGEGEIYPELFE